MTITESKSFPAPRPSKMTIFLRHFPLWQLLRFAIINVKMTAMILKSHDSPIEPTKVKAQQDPP